MGDDRPRLHIDIETYSEIDLKLRGAYRYAHDDSFLVLMAAWSFDGSPTQLYTDLDQIDEIPGLWDPEVLKVAHNAQFERVCFTKFKGLPLGKYLDPRDYRDTAAIAAELGLPRKLENLAPRLGATPKDTAGTRLINIFCKPNRKGERTLPEEKPVEWLEFGMYNIQDTDTLREVDALIDWPNEAEAEIFIHDQLINDRGMPIDVELARVAQLSDIENTILQKARVTELTEGAIENANSLPQFKKWLWSEGVEVDDLRADTVVELLTRDELTPVQREVLQLRQELALAASAKYSAALGSVLPDDRIHGSFLFFGAHTGRWSGRGAQPQNLPRAHFTLTPEQEIQADQMRERGVPKEEVEEWKRSWEDTYVNAAIVDLKLGLGADAESLKKLVRSMFEGPFTVVDYGAIEARVIAWLAGEEWVLQAFREGRDLYVETADRMGGLDRSQGKIAVLAFGFNGGAGSLRAMSGQRFFMDRNGKVVTGGTMAEAASHASAALDDIKEMDDDELREKFVLPWRKANPQIAKLWPRLQNAFKHGGQAGPILTVKGQGADRLLQLPSGRAIAYRKCEARGQGRDERLSFLQGDGRRAYTYGGRLSENATQAVARDIMAEAIVRLQNEGIPVVGHVHDEVIMEGEHDLEMVKEIMFQVPSWAEGLPIDGEGFITERYKKG